MLTKLATIVFLTVAVLTTAATGDGPVRFNRDVLPILSDRCFLCHGPDEASREAELRLDQEASALAVAIEPGDADASELVARITSDDPDVRMPPPDSKLQLAANEIGLLRRWIDEGAAWQNHWAFLPVEKPAVPTVQNTAWPRNAIDNFVARKLEEAGLAPAEEATREQLIRRLSFDLTGLPPTLEEIDAFLFDNQEGAYRRVVDRLLNSPAFGERLASDWLDAARYSDTYGYQVDRDRFVWPWRDWVVGAFNRNLPYDEFIHAQLAGDLLADADDAQILATTFNRLHPQKVEGGSTPEEFRVEYVADRTQTFATAFLGLTMECCRCHDHKYDPLSQTEYYQLSAFFDKIDEAGLYSYFTQSVPTPTHALASDDEKQQLEERAQAVATAERRLRDVAEQRAAAYEAWLRADPQPKPVIPGEIKWLTFEAFSDGKNQQAPGVDGKAVQLTGDDGIDVGVGNFHRYDPFSVSLWLKTPDIKERAVVFHRSRAWTDAASRGYQLLIEQGRLSASLIHFWPGNAIRIRTTQALPIERWQHVAVVWDGSNRASGLRIFLNGREAAVEIVRDRLTKNITGGGGDNITIGERFRDRGFTRGLVDEFRVFDRELTPLEAAHLADGSSLTEALADRQESAANDALRTFYLAAHDGPYREQLEELRQRRKALCELQDGLQEIMVMRDEPGVRRTYLLDRGAYDARSAEVAAETPAALPPMPAGVPRNRLGLAEWLTQPNHPLTARVAVNRYWQLIFGHGLVRTPEDFGRQGQPPTHPELLDFLASDFVQHGWDVKRLLKLITMSAAYRQTSTPPANSLAADPLNLLLSWSPSYRLPAEMLRDNALSASQLLVSRLGGPPAKPYEVEVSFKPADRDQGEGLYRRSLYTYWKRTGPAPVMMTLDASKRDVCRVRRERTSTPLEAFVLMNGPQFVEAARALAARQLSRHGDDSRDALAEMFRLLTARRPNAAELAVLLDLHRSQLDYFQARPEEAAVYLESGDFVAPGSPDACRLAALASVANALLSFEEVVTRS